MQLEIRTATSPQEGKAALAPIWHYFGSVPDDELWGSYGQLFELDRMHIAWDGSTVAGAASAFSFDMSIPGATVPTAGVTVVGVFPTHRRRGVLSALMREQLDDVHRRGEPMAALWASEEPIYPRFGYGLASLSATLRIDRERTAFRPGVEARGRVRLVSAQEAARIFPEIYERVRREVPGMLSRSPLWWEVRHLSDPKNQRGGGGVKNYAVLELDGRDAAYATYRFHQKWEEGSAVGRAAVLSAIGDSPQATAEIWRFLLDLDWTAVIETTMLPVDHELLLLLQQPRRARLRIGDALWVRLVDVEAAFAARSLNDGEPVVLELEDAFCSWNTGRYELSPEGLTRTTAAPELRLTAEHLACTFLGGFTMTDLHRALRVEELVPGACRRADVLLATPRKPWCPEIF
jgi:predicted acetyltransferase